MQKPATQREALPNDICGLIKRLKEELKCSIWYLKDLDKREHFVSNICSLSVFEDPTMTPCNHTFCRSCIERAICMTKKSSALPINECPICKSKAPKRSLNPCAAAAKLCHIYEEIVRSYSEMIGGNEDWIHEAGLRTNDAYYTGGGVPLENLSQLYPYPEKPKQQQLDKIIENENVSESQSSDLFSDFTDLEDFVNINTEGTSRIYDETTQLDTPTVPNLDPDSTQLSSLNLNNLPAIPSSPLIHPDDTQYHLTVNTQEWEKLEAINESIDRELAELEKKLAVTVNDKENNNIAVVVDEGNKNDSKSKIRVAEKSKLKENGTSKEKENETSKIRVAEKSKLIVPKSSKITKVNASKPRKSKTDNFELKDELKDEAEIKVKNSTKKAKCELIDSVKFTTTAIKDENLLIQLADFSEKFSCPVLPDLKQCDHLIIPTGPGLIVKKRTMKYFEALILGKEIVSYEWIGACMNAGKILSTIPYMIKGDEIGIKKVNRRNNNNSSNKKDYYSKMFSVYKFYFYGEFSQPPRDQLENLIRSANCTIIEDVNDLAKGSIVLADPTSQTTFEKDARIIKKYPIVSPNWLLDSISCGRTLEFHEYLIL